MTYSYTPKTALPFPQADEKIGDANHHIHVLATMLDDLVVMRFTTQAALAAAISAPVSGQTAWITTDKVLQIFDGTAWQRVYPPVPNIYSGTTNPTSVLGTVGDVYLQYT